MMALAAANLGVTVRCLDPTENAPAAVAAEHVLGHFRDAEAVERFAKDVDVLTVEIEHVDVDAYEQGGLANGVDIQPAPQTIRVIQDKYLQKVHFRSHGIPTPDFRDIPSPQELLLTGTQHFGFPLMLKTKRLAYDGRGNYVIRSLEDIPKGATALGGYEKGLYAEKWAPFVKELAVMVVRSTDGTVVSYPVVETIHKDNICYVTEAPANVPARITEKARKVAEQTVACLYGAGIFGVEMFLMADGSILVNEVAPRPHNSGHYTIDGCVTSQFENHARAILGWPLGDTSLNTGCAIMLNLIGEADDEEGERIAHERMARAYKTPGCKVHWYGKAGIKVGRKVGHINVVAKTREEARRRLAAIDPEAAATLRKTNTALVGSEAGQAALKTQVGIIMGSTSDLNTMKEAAKVLEQFGIGCEVTVVSAHRTPERMVEYAQTAHQRGVKVIIAGAGGAAHLPGMVAALTPLPVVGVPVKPSGAYLDGMDALLSIVQMPRGVPVATVAIGNAANAGLLAVRIIASAEPALLAKMLQYQADMKEMILDRASQLEEMGWKDYKEAH